MIKALLESDGKDDCLLIGLNKNDLDNLKTRDVKIALSDYGLPGYKLFLVYGETDSEIKTDLLALAGHNNIPIIDKTQSRKKK